MKKYLIVLLALLLAAMGWAGVSAQDEAIAEVEAAAETAPSPEDGATSIAIWLNPNDAAESRLIATDDDFGLIVYDLAGEAVQSIEFDEEALPNKVDLIYNFPYGDEEITLIVVGLDEQTTVLFYTIDAESTEIREIGSIETGIEHAGICLYRSPFTDNFYFFTNGGDNGDVEQWLIDGSEGEIVGELAREFSVGSETEDCVADSELGNYFVSEEEVAVWRYGAEPDAGPQRQIVDLVGGGIEGEVEGLAIYYAADGAGYLFASNQSASTILVYTRDGSEFLGEFAVVEGDMTDALEEAGGLDVINAPLNDTFGFGMFLAADDANDNDENNNFKLVPFEDIAEALGLEVDADYDPRGLMANQSNIATVFAAAETTPVPSGSDAADDPAIWIHPTDPNLSTVIGTDKTAGLVVYNLDGTILQTLNIGRVNNVDIRYNFMLAGSPTAIVTATNRTDNSIVVYAVNPDTRMLEDVRGQIYISPAREVYGLCMYIDPTTGRYYTIPNSVDGVVEQLELVASEDGTINLVSVRSWQMDSQPEGCVGDDELGYIYVGEEARGVWRYDGNPDAPAEGLLVAEADANPLTVDVEGMAIYYGPDGSGYLIVSSQGSSQFVLYDRQTNDLIGAFQVAQTDTVDGVSGTDGLDVTNAALGDAFPDGLFVTQDDNNINPDENQNFKLVSWREIAEAMGLIIDTSSFDPRRVGAE